MNISRNKYLINYNDEKYRVLADRDKSCNCPQRFRSFCWQTIVLYHIREINAICTKHWWDLPSFSFVSLFWSSLYEIHKQKLEYVQRNFLKYLAFKREGIYPPRGLNHETLVTEFMYELLPLGRLYASQIFYLLHTYTTQTNNTFNIPIFHTNTGTNKVPPQDTYKR